MSDITYLSENVYLSGNTCLSNNEYSTCILFFTFVKGTKNNHLPFSSVFISNIMLQFGQLPNYALRFIQGFVTEMVITSVAINKLYN